MKLPAVTLEFWNEMGFKPATAEQISKVQALIGQSLPTDYADFLRRFGFVEWDIDIPDTFEYRIGGPDQTVIRSAYVTHISTIDYMQDFIKFGRADNPSLGLPHFPATHFPIAGGGGQDRLLLELTPTPGRIWYWPEREDPWGTGDNTELGYVADSFTGFIEGLRLGD